MEKCLVYTICLKFDCGSGYAACVNHACSDKPMTERNVMVP